jgi:TonB-linked SusC/RagA family outer membrane protein
MNFSASHAGGLPCNFCTAALVWLIKEPNIRQLMRISVLLIALMLTTFTMLMATNGNGQGAETTNVTLALKDESLLAALKKIEALTPFRFVYRNNEVKAINNLNLDPQERTVAATLALILAETPFTYREINTNILIYKEDDVPSKADASTATVIDHTISGKVLDETGSPLAGVSIVLKGTTIGTSTDAQGNYSLALPEATGTLVFSFIGYKTEEIDVANRSIIDLTLAPDIQSLNEVVVTALGITREEKSLGYATQEVKAKNLTFTKEQNVVGSLSGKIAGVQVIGSPGASMGGTQKIKIRGVNLLDGKDQPLFVLDGTPMSNANFSERNGQDYGNALQDINPDDIESINVLKGPAASALYGLRGQSGVVMITTKKGRRGAKKVSIDYSGAASFERAGNFMPNQNLYGGGSTQTFATLDNGQPYSNLDYDESWGPKMDGTPVRQFYSFFPQDPDYGKLTPYVPHPDNIKDYYEIGSTINNNLSITGGAENSTFRVSYNRTTISGVEPNTWLKRNNFGFSGSLDVMKKLQLSTSINYANNRGQRPSQGYDNGSTYFNQWFQRNLDMNRLKNYRYADGTFLHWNLDNPDGDGTISTKPLYWNNPYFEAYENTSQDSRDRFFGNVAVAYQIVPDLTVTGTVRADLYTQNIDLRSANGGRYIEGYSIDKAQNQEMNYELLVQYKKQFGEFSLDATLGGNVMTQKYSSLTQKTVGGLITPGFYNVSNSVDRPIAESYLREKEIRSWFGVVSVGYKDTWFLDASLRNDNSTALPANNNSYWYPSVSGSAVFSELIDWEPLSLGKIRVSYAMAGYDLDPYKTTKYYELGTSYTSDPVVNSLFVPDQLNNPNLEPSFSNSIEGGLDLKFFSNRLGLNVTFYKQVNENQILTLPVSGASGYSTAVINAGVIENKGYEIALTAIPLRTNKFTWDMSFNIAKNKSMVVELYNDGTTEINNYQIASNTYAGRTVSVNAHVGEAYGNLIGQAYLRDPATGLIMLGSNNLPLYESNHNFGSVLPDFTGGLQNTFSYGPVSLNAMIDFQVGGKFFSWSRMLSVKSGQAVETAAINENGKNVRDPVAEGGGVKVHGISSVTGEEVTTYVSARSYYRNSLGRDIYEEWMYDASYVRLREVRLAYNFGKINKLPVNSLSIALIARNPLMLYQKAPEGLNPAELANGSEPISWLETGQLITVRSYGISVNLSF